MKWTAKASLKKAGRNLKRGLGDKFEKWHNVPNRTNQQTDDTNYLSGAPQGTQANKQIDNSILLICPTILKGGYLTESEQASGLPNSTCIPRSTTHQWAHFLKLSFGAPCVAIAFASVTSQVLKEHTGRQLATTSSEQAGASTNMVLSIRAVEVNTGTCAQLSRTASSSLLRLRPCCRRPNQPCLLLCPCITSAGGTPAGVGEVPPSPR